eukprot:scaffold17.g466.t1
MQQALSTFRGFKPATTAPRPSAARALAPRPARQAAAVRASTVAEPAQLEVRALDGAAAGSAQLALRVAEADTQKGLVHRYLVLVQQNARAGTASTLTRSEVRGGGRKPYKQKGSGNARRGSKRSPLMPGGGISFGPKPRDWSIDMNRKERRLALATALQSAAGDMVVVQDFGGQLGGPKTSALLERLAAVGVSLDQKTLIILNQANEDVYLSGRNVAKLAINTADRLQVFDVLGAEKIVVEESALAYINEFYGGEQQPQQS